MKLKLLVLGLFFLPFSNGSAQVLKEQWTKIHGSDKSETLNSLVELWDGQVIGVGSASTKEDAAEADGVIWILNSSSSDLKRKMVQFAAPGSDTFTDALQLKDGSVLILGNVKVKSGMYRCRLLMLNERNWTIIQDTIYDGLTMIYGEKMLLTRKGEIAIAGRVQGGPGNIGMYRISANLESIQEKAVIQSGQYHDLTGLHELANGDFILCGNAQKVGKGRTDGNYLISTISSDLTLKDLGYAESREINSINYAHSSYDGGLVIIGDTYISRSVRDPWILEIDRRGQRTNRLQLETKPFDRGLGIVKSYDEKYFCLSNYLNEYEAFIFDQRDQKKDAKEFIPANGGDFTVSRMLIAQNDAVWLGGNWMENARSKSQVIISNITSESAARGSTKSLTTLRISKAPSLVDANQDGLLEPDERAYVSFSLSNEGPEDFFDGHLQVNAVNLVEGVDFYDRCPLSFIESGGDREITIPIAGSNLLGSGVSDFTVSVLNQSDRSVLDLDFSIESIGDDKIEATTPPPAMVKIRWRAPFGAGQYVSRNRTGSETLELEVLPDKELRKEHFTIYVDGVPISDSKSPFAFEDISTLNDFAYKLVFNLELEEKQSGEPYEVYVQVMSDGKPYRSEVGTIFYQARRPNLHLLAIGPEFDLNYNGNDVRDFVGMFKDQANNGYFGQVFIDSLITKEATSKTAIQKQFERLYKRFMQPAGTQKIYENDMLIVFVSSHGKMINESFRILPSDYDETAAWSTSIDYKGDILYFLNLIQCSKVVFIDACHSGAAKSKDLVISPEISDALNLLAEQSPGISTITSSSKDELSYEDERWKNGVFTEALLEALLGEPVALQDEQIIWPNEDRDIDGLLTIGELFRFLEKRVPDLMSRRFDGQKSQTPFMPRKELNDKIVLYKIPSSE